MNHTHTFTKRIANELAVKLQGVVADWDGCEVEGQNYNTLLDKLEAYEPHQPITLNVWECEACANELENSSEAMKENGYRSVAREFTAKAAELYSSI